MRRRLKPEPDTYGMLQRDARALEAAMQRIQHPSVSYDETECFFFVFWAERGIQRGFAESIDLTYEGVGCYRTLKFRLLAHAFAPWGWIAAISAARRPGFLRCTTELMQATYQTRFPARRAATPALEHALVLDW